MNVQINGCWGDQATGDLQKGEHRNKSNADWWVENSEEFDVH